MSGCHYPSPPPQEQDRRYQHKVSLVVRYFMIPCNICLILLATSTLGFAVLLFLNNCTLVQQKQKRHLVYCVLFNRTFMAPKCTGHCLEIDRFP